MRYGPGRAVCRGSLRLEDEGLLEVSETAVQQSSPEATPVHALGHKAVAFRRTALDAVGGLDAVFGNDLGAAVADLCFRLRQAEWWVVFLPRAIAVSATPNEIRSGSGHSPAWGLMEQRWLRGSDPERTRSKSST